MCAASSHLKWSESNTNCPAHCCTVFFSCLSLQKYAQLEKEGLHGMHFWDKEIPFLPLWVTI